MNLRLVVTTVLVTAAIVVIGQLTAQAGNSKRRTYKRIRIPYVHQTSEASETPEDGGIAGEGGPPVCGTGTPDVIVGDLTGPYNWSDPTYSGNPQPPNPPVGPVDGYVHYSLGTTSCNIGRANLDWYDNGPNPTKHPVIAQNIYRLDNGRFEQIGLSWLKHGFCALQGGLCDTAQDPCVSACPDPTQSCCADELGCMCSDPYSSERNGRPNGLGPRAGVNAALGKITIWNHPQPLNTGEDYVNDNGQIHVRVEDIDPILNPNAVYYAEGHYLAEDDATAGNDDNNASWKRVVPDNEIGFPLHYVGPISQEEQAIYAWQDVDPGVVIVHADVDGDGRFTLGYRATENCDGTWHYEYAIHNMNSHDSGRSFSVPIHPDISITNIGFHDVDYHSGDGEVIGTNYDGTDWTVTQTTTELTWSTDDYATDPNANALRWGTLYNFRFDSNSEPEAADTALGLYRSGGTKIFSAIGPKRIPLACPADIAPSVGPDGQINVDDLLGLIANWGNPGAGDISPPCGNNMVDVDDLLALIGLWGPCP